MFALCERQRAAAEAASSVLPAAKPWSGRALPGRSGEMRGPRKIKDFPGMRQKEDALAGNGADADRGISGSAEAGRVMFALCERQRAAAEAASSVLPAAKPWSGRALPGRSGEMRGPRKIKDFPGMRQKENALAGNGADADRGISGSAEAGRVIFALRQRQRAAA